jgi:CcmD family protein
MMKRTTSTTSTMISRTKTAIIAGAAALAWPLAALAQEFQKVEGKATQEVPAVPFVGIAYGFIWIAVLAYVVFVARGLGRVRGELDELRRKVDRAAGEPPAPGARAG